MVESDLIKTIQVVSTNLNDIEFTIEVDERYFVKDDEFKDLNTGMQFIVVERPYRNSQGRSEIRCKLLSKIQSLRYTENKVTEWMYEPGYVRYVKKIEDERTEV